MLAWLPPTGVDRLHMPPGRGAVEHVVVNKRRGVDHLDHGPEQMMGRANLAARLSSEEQERGAGAVCRDSARDG